MSDNASPTKSEQSKESLFQAKNARKEKTKTCPRCGLAEPREFGLTYAVCRGCGKVYAL
jgi:transposase-like protein